MAFWQVPTQVPRQVPRAIAQPIEGVVRIDVSCQTENATQEPFQGHAELPSVPRVSEMELLAEIARVEAARLAEIARVETARLAQIARAEAARLANQSLTDYASGHLTENADRVQSDLEDIQDQIDRGEGVNGLSLDDLCQLLLILNFLTGDFLFDYLDIFDLSYLPAAQWYDCCMDCCNTTQEEEWANYLRTVDSNIRQVLSMVEESGELSPALREHIQERSTYVFHNYDDFDCVVSDRETQSEASNYVDIPRTHFRLLVRVLLNICEVV